MRRLRHPMLEAVAQRLHVGVRLLEQLKSSRHDFNVPRRYLGLLPGLEAEVEVSGILRVEAESVHGSFGIGVRVGCQPSLCTAISFDFVSIYVEATHLCPPCYLAGICHAASSRRPSSP